LSRPLKPTVPALNPQLQLPWNLTQIGILVLPLSSLIGCILLALAALLVWGKQFRTLIRNRINQGLFLLTTLLVITCFTAFQPSDAFLGLFNFLPFFLVFAAFSHLVQSPGQLRRLAWLIVLGSVPIVLLGLGQLFLGFTGNFYLLWSAIDWKIYPGGNPPGRMASVFDYANVLANYLVITFALGLGLWIKSFPWQGKAEGRRQKVEGQAKEEDGKTPTIVRKPYSSSSLLNTVEQWVLLTAILLLQGAGLVLTNSRNAWAIAVLVCLAYAVYLGWRWLLVLVGAIAGSVLGAAFAPDPIRQWLRAIVPAFFWARLTDELYPNRPLPMLRTTQWQFAWDLAQQRPLTGWGLRNFTPLYQAKMQFWLGHPHNLFLMSLAETGFPATILLFGLVGWVIGRGILLLRRWGKVVIAHFNDRLILFSYITTFLACTLFNMSDITLFDARMNSLGWIILAAIWGVTTHDRFARQSE
jgi:O-antigen ligase